MIENAFVREEKLKKWRIDVCQIQSTTIGRPKMTEHVLTCFGHFFGFYYLFQRWTNSLVTFLILNILFSV